MRFLRRILRRKDVENEADKTQDRITQLVMLELHYSLDDLRRKRAMERKALRLAKKRKKQSNRMVV